MLQAIVTRDKFLIQSFPQSEIRRRIRRSQVVDRFNQTCPKKMSPQSIDHRTREIGVRRISHPVDEHFAGIAAVGNGGLGPIEWTRRQHLSGPRLPYLNTRLTGLFNLTLNVGNPLLGLLNLFCFGVVGLELCQLLFFLLILTVKIELVPCPDF